jgi:pimeloyl-ACP methyl ester carboxylesterase
MPPPLIATGLSWGCVSIVSLAIFHPRLFSGIVLMEPTLRTTSAVRRVDRIDTGIDRSHRAVAMVKRRDLWPSLEDASNRLRATPHFGPFDSRVFERVIKYHLRPASPAMQSYIGSPEAVTLTTPKSMEVGTMMRPDPPFGGHPEAADFHNRPEDLDTTIVQGFYRGEFAQVYRDLPYVLPATLYVWGSRSLGGTAYSKDIAGRTGVGYGGNGGLDTGRVQEIVLDDMGHNIPLDKPGRAAEAVDLWLREELTRWEIDFEERNQQPEFKVALGPEWRQRIAKL